MTCKITAQRLLGSKREKLDFSATVSMLHVGARREGTGGMMWQAKSWLATALQASMIMAVLPNCIEIVNVPRVEHFPMLCSRTGKDQISVRTQRGICARDPKQYPVSLLFL